MDIEELEKVIEQIKSEESTPPDEDMVHEAEVTLKVYSEDGEVKRKVREDAVRGKVIEDIKR